MEELNEVMLYDLNGNMNYVSMLAQLVKLKELSANENTFLASVNDDFSGIVELSDTDERSNNNDINMFLSHIGKYVMGIDTSDIYRISEEGYDTGIITRSSESMPGDKYYTLSDSLQIAPSKIIGNPAMQEIMIKMQELLAENHGQKPQLKTIRECKLAVEYGKNILSSLASNDIERKNMLKSYFDMILFDALSANEGRTSDKYGVIHNQNNGSLRMASLSNNMGINKNESNPYMTSLNDFDCEKENLLKCLFKFYYDEIKDTTTSWNNSMANNLKNIEYLASVELKPETKDFVYPIIEEQYKKIVSLDKEKKGELGEPETPISKEYEEEKKLSEELHQNMEQNLIESKEKEMGELRKKRANQQTLKNSTQYGFVAVVSVLGVFLMATCFCILILSFVLSR